MKRFDFAGEVAKQTITIASAIITVLLAFYEKFFSHAAVVYFLVLIDLLVFALSIMFGVFSVGGIVNLVETQEYIDAARENSTGQKLSPVKRKFVRLGGTLATKFAVWQQVLFFVALIDFIFIAIFDRMGIFGSQIAMGGPG
jgi:hypothetical protein